MCIRHNGILTFTLNHRVPKTGKTNEMVTGGHFVKSFKTIVPLYFKQKKSRKSGEIYWKNSKFIQLPIPWTNFDNFFLWLVGSIDLIIGVLNCFRLLREKSWKASKAALTWPWTEHVSGSAQFQTMKYSPRDRYFSLPLIWQFLDPNSTSYKRCSEHMRRSYTARVSKI